MTITLSGVPPSLNRFAGRENSREYRDSKDTWTRLAWAGARAAGAGAKPPPEKALVTITYHFPDRRRRDPDNYCGKVLLDGLTKARAIRDDSFDHISLLLRQGPCDGKARTVIRIDSIGGPGDMMTEEDRT